MNLYSSSKAQKLLPGALPDPQAGPDTAVGFPQSPGLPHHSPDHSGLSLCEDLPSSLDEEPYEYRAHLARQGQAQRRCTINACLINQQDSKGRQQSWKPHSGKKNVKHRYSLFGKEEARSSLLSHVQALKKCGWCCSPGLDQNQREAITQRQI